VYYPVTENTPFDFIYWREHHIPMALELWDIEGAETDRGLDGPHVAAVHFTFDSLDRLHDALNSEGTKLILDDVPNYTTITPVLQTSEILRKV
jgi:uncharacterized protein (TIGR02118 family)